VLSVSLKPLYPRLADPYLRFRGQLLLLLPGGGVLHASGSAPRQLPAALRDQLQALGSTRELKRLRWGGEPSLVEALVSLQRLGAGADLDEAVNGALIIFPAVRS
jgi:hypothetical protein